ncbi:MAG: phospholipase D-like domain-containing protein [Chloroflexota bacterium]
MKKRDAGIWGTILLVILGILSIIFGTDLIEESGLNEDGSFGDNSGIPSQLPPISSDPLSQDWYEIYFTDPVCAPEDQRFGGVDEIIAESFSEAEVRVDIAAFELNLESIVNALIDLEERGIEVRVVTDEDNADESAINRLRRNGISVIEDKRSALMHNKFAVIDGRYVWVGSMNFTTNGSYCNNNNMLIFDSPRLAANYTAEMDEMYNEQQFGPDSPVNTPNEQLIIQGVEIENYFGPEKDIAPIIARTVARAQESILFMAFSFTDERVGEAILGRADSGVVVQGVFETVGSETTFSYYPPMRDAGLPNLEVRQDGNGRIMHHKIIIVDFETVIFGSFNFSENANRRNDENVMIVKDTTFANFFVEEFTAVWDEAAP